LPLPEKQTITADYLIVGEGDGDSEFARYLCEVRDIAGFEYDHAQGNKDFENS
jgi:hypothetical protein